MLAVLAVGAALGYAAANPGLNPFRSTQAAPTDATAAAPADCPLGGNCCEGVDKAALLAINAHNAKVSATAQKDGKKPNIVVIMGDDIGMWNIGAYHRGLMAGKTPNLDKLAKEGMLFTDYYAEASCTAGRAAFVTGQLPIRTGMTTVGQAGAKIGLPAQACTIATALKDLGYARGQFGKNHLGDLNEYLPTVHGFDEFFGYLYHLDAMEDPAHPNYPQELLNRVGPRNMVHSWATDKDDETVMPRWGKIGKQKIEDAGTLYPKRMETVDDEIRDLSFKFLDKAKADNKPFFLWLNPTRMHIVTHLSDKYQEELRNAKNWLGASKKPGWRSSTTISDWSCRKSRIWAWTTTPSSCSPPTTAPRRSPGRTAAPRRSRGRRDHDLRGRVPATPGNGSLARATSTAGTVENGIISGLD